MHRAVSLSLSVKRKTSSLSTPMLCKYSKILILSLTLITTPGICAPSRSVESLTNTSWPKGSLSLGRSLYDVYILAQLHMQLQALSMLATIANRMLPQDHTLCRYRLQLC